MFKLLKKRWVTHFKSSPFELKEEKAFGSLAAISANDLRSKAIEDDFKTVH